MGGCVCGYGCSMNVCVWVCGCTCVLEIDNLLSNVRCGGGTDGQLQINSCGYTIS